MALVWFPVSKGLLAENHSVIVADMGIFLRYILFRFQEIIFNSTYSGKNHNEGGQNKLIMIQCLVQ